MRVGAFKAELKPAPPTKRYLVRLIIHDCGQGAVNQRS